MIDASNHWIINYNLPITHAQAPQKTMMRPPCCSMCLMTLISCTHGSSSYKANPCLRSHIQMSTLQPQLRVRVHMHKQQQQQQQEQQQEQQQLSCRGCLCLRGSREKEKEKEGWVKGRGVWVCRGMWRSHRT